MEKRILGKTGLEVGILGLGGANHNRVSPEELMCIIDRAEEVGANCLDLYWNCEELIAKTLRGRRGKFVLMSKIEISPGQVDGLPEEKRDATVQIEESLRRLSTDYIDVCQLHYVTDDTAFDKLCVPEGTIDKMLKAQKEGKVRFLGITSHHPTVLSRAIKTGYFATLMAPFNVVRRQFGQDASLGLFELAQRLNVGVVIMKPIAYGRMHSNIPRALQFIWAHPVTVAIPGATSLAQWNLDISAAQHFSAMTAEEQKRCRDEAWLLQSNYCTGCGYCLPCPSEMNVPELMRMERYTEVFGLTEWLSEERVGKLFVNMSRCENCGICEERCPKDLPIRERLNNCLNYFNHLIN
jgi:predicted aldo/keto reductase-like oxidoreductase